MSYLETPQTDAGNATYMTNGRNLDNMSVENSLLSPIRRREDDLLSQMRNKRDVNLKTPRGRAPFGNRKNLLAAPAQGEFTPLLKSATKRNMARAGKENVLTTPAFLKPGYQGKDSPALRAPESSMLYGDDTGSEAGGHSEEILLTQVPSSSAQSTPLAALPRNGDGALGEQGNMMALREQGNIIDKIEKENFGLKLKIHFLEESLRKAAPDFHQAALSENTELKVDKVTMQKELSRTRKILLQAERDVRDFKLQLREAQEKTLRKHADKKQQVEMEQMRSDLKAKESEVEELRRGLEDKEGKEREVEALRDDLEDVEAELRDKDRQLEELEDKIESFKESTEKVTQLQEELKSKEDKVKELQEEVQQVNARAEEANGLHDKALSGRQKAEENLHELRDEMANKSFITNGLNRQSSEEASRMQNDLNDLRKNYLDIQSNHEEKTHEAQQLKDVINKVRKESEVNEQEFRKENATLRQGYDAVINKCDALERRMQSISKELQDKTEEKDLLQSRHDALTSESQSLQRDLNKSQAKIQALEQSLKDEKEHALGNDQALRHEARDEFDRLNGEVGTWRRKLEEQHSHALASEEGWKVRCRELELGKEEAEQKASGLQRTVQKLQENHGTLSGREIKFQEALESEQLRHRGEEALLTQQIKELQEIIEEKQRILEDNRIELLRNKEEIQVGQTNRAAAKETIQSLEDELDVLQGSLDDEAEKAKESVSSARQEAFSLRQQLMNTKSELSRIMMAHASAQSELEVVQGGLSMASGSTDLTTGLWDLEEKLRRMRSEKQRLQDHLAQTNIDLYSLRASLASAEADCQEISNLRDDLSTSRKNEMEHIQREASYKDNVRSLKHDIADLETKLVQSRFSRLAADSPKSSVSGSACKSGIAELRRQLGEANQQMKDLRSKATEVERDLRAKLAASERETLHLLQESEDQQAKANEEISSLTTQLHEQQAKVDCAEKTTARLRTKILDLDKDIRTARLNRIEDNTIAEERKDLHEMLKDAKLEAEDLQVQIADKESRIQAASIREKDLRNQLKRARDERTLQTQRLAALMTELDNLQHRYEGKIDEAARKQRACEEERNAILSRVRFTNASVSSIHDPEELKQLETTMRESEKRHKGELKGLAKQIQCLRAWCRREEGFREGLAFEKRFLMMKIEMFETCNSIDLSLLEQMGVRPERTAREKRPTLRAAVLMVVAGIRMRKLSQDWAVQRRLQAALVKKAEQVRRASRKSIARS